MAGARDVALGATRLKSQALRGFYRAMSGVRSRRITDEHRIVYRVEGDALLIAQLRFHY